MQNSSRSQVDPFIVMDVMEAARRAEAQGRHIIHMEVGQPGTPAPQGARDAVRGAIKADALGYTVALGLPELRARIAQLYADWYGVALDPARVVVTSGSSAAFLLAFTALFEAGDTVAIGSPGYPSYRQILKALSLNVDLIPTSLDARLQLTPDQIRQARAQGVMVASPANPTGTMLDRTALAALIEAAHEVGTAFISDEIYHGLDYDTKPVTALQITDEAYVINSFSKYFSMTGWRIGWMIVPQDHVRTIERLAQNMFICPPHVSQVAALAAMDCSEELDRNLAVYHANRALMIEQLPMAGLADFAPPDGAFYIYVDVSAYTDDSRTFAAQILDEVGVAVTPGLDFDPERGHHTLRLSYARSTDDIREGLARLRRFMDTRRT